MRKTRNVKLNLLSLENRLTPTVTTVNVGSITATHNSVNGNLSVLSSSDQDRTIWVDYHGATTDVYALQGTYDPTAAGAGYPTRLSNKIASFGQVDNVTVRGHNGDDFIVFTMDDGTTLAGNFTASTGAGEQLDTEQVDSVQMQTANNLGATIDGRVNLIGGFSANDAFIFDLTVNGTTTINNARNFGYRDQGGNNVYASVFQFSNTTFNKSVNVINAITLMDDAFGPNTINGNLYVNDTKQNPSGSYQTMSGDQYPHAASAADAYVSLFVMDNDNTINGNVRFAGTLAEAPGGIVSNGVGMFINGTVTGNIIASANADGLNDWVFGDQGSGATIGGNVTVVGGVNGKVPYTNSAQNVEIHDGVAFAGRVKIALGHGDNTYDLDNAFTIGNFSQANGYGFSLTAGNGDNNLALGGAIGGNVNVRFGNGDNTADFNFVGALANIKFASGSGIDSVTLNGNYRSFNGRFGAGDDSFAYGALASLVSGSGAGFWGDFGAGTDTFDSSAVAPVGWNQTIRNAEVVI